jgi:hypothetical protein
MPYLLSMATVVFFDTEFTSLLDPHLLSVGLVTAGGREHYAELNLQSEFGQTRLTQTPWDVRENVVDKFGLFPDSLCDSERSLGLRVGEWLLNVAKSSPDGRIGLLYDYGVDFELLVGALEECGLWSQVRDVAGERNVASETGSIGPELASEATFATLRHRRQPPLFRHHALSDALALRAAWRTWHLVHERTSAFNRLLQAAAGDAGAASADQAWFYEWLAAHYIGLDDQVPLDVLDEAGGLELVEAALVRRAYNVF